MKKVFLSILLLFSFVIIANSQETKNTHFVIDWNNGFSKFCNYSGLSNINDNKESHIGRFMQTDVGIIRHEKGGIFLDMEINDINMRYNEMFNEKCFLGYGGVSLAFIGKVSDKFSIEPRFGCGILSLSNKIYYNDKDYTMNRIGNGCKFSLLFSYKLLEHLYCGVNGEFFSGHIKNKDLPDELKTYSMNHNNDIYSANLSIGFRAIF